MKPLLLMTAALLASALAADAAAQDAPGPVLRVAATRVKDTGAMSGYAMGTNDFAIGKPVTTFKYVGNIARGDDTGCEWLGGSDDGVFPLEQLVRDKAVVWKVTTTARSFENGRMTFDVEWARYARANSTRPVASDRVQLSLAEGERYLLDLWRPAAACGGSIVVDVEAAMREDVAVADSVLQYEVWLVHTDPSGRKTSQRLNSSGQHGMRVPFAFTPLRFAVPVMAPDQFPFDVTTRVTGALRGRVERDGRLLVEVQTTRKDALERRDTAGTTGTLPPFGGEGTKFVSLAPAEAIEIELPNSGGVSKSYASRAAAEGGRGKTVGGRAAPSGGSASGGPAVALEDGRVVVRFKEFFEGHRVSLILRAKGVDQP